MPRITMNRGFIARWTRMPHSTGRLSASATSHHSLSSAAFITNIAESDFRHAQAELAATDRGRAITDRGTNASSRRRFTWERSVPQSTNQQFGDTVAGPIIGGLDHSIRSNRVSAATAGLSLSRASGGLALA